MTSKEALERIKLLWFEYDGDDGVYLVKYECFEKVEKDLEILEILKNIIKAHNYNDESIFSLKINTDKNNTLAQEEFNKIKEWLNE